MTSASCHQIYNRYFDAMPFRPVQSGIRNLSERMNVHESAGEGYIDRRITSTGMEIVHSVLRIKQEQPIQVQSDAAMIELSFCLQGKGEVSVSGSAHELVPGSCTLHVMRDFSAAFHYDGDAWLRAVAIGVPVALFERYLEMTPGGSKLSIDGLLGSGSFRMFRQPISPETTRLLHELQTCPYTSAMREMYAESKAMELLAVYLGSFLFDNDSRSVGASGLSKTDRMKIREAERLLLRHMDDPPSLLELSRMIGLNDYKLKIGFKAEYGKSVFAYLRGKRMERAWELLEAGDISVSQAASAVGYANFSHFAEEFHKRYGIKPSELSRSRRYL
ncbi:helix-turn-helix transcriptional regulator [Paenibacillus contaminans]|uniref:AraC family transcriptional regulator n=1 Tax=Paenibacillus contaminans TaxID=450362 RepID=A0A329MTE5_9BACL|nr:AraC family transcriptional regulator [Paenibacillus contaminans]RAV22810.1 AraC family transcriptional regulator [Paenibacillus contaminans]